VFHISASLYKLREIRDWYQGIALAMPKIAQFFKSPLGAPVGDFNFSRIPAAK
jgi:hypothetical protein